MTEHAKDNDGWIACDKEMPPDGSMVKTKAERRNGVVNLREDEMLRVRFKANYDDPRPVNWPVKHPFWVSGSGDGYSTVISYADDENYIMENWPEAQGTWIRKRSGAITLRTGFRSPIG